TRAVEQAIDRASARGLGHQLLDRAPVAQVDLLKALVREGRRLLDVGRDDRTAEALDDARSCLAHSRETAGEQTALARVAEQVLHAGSLPARPVAGKARLSGLARGRRLHEARRCTLKRSRSAAASTASRPYTSLRCCSTPARSTQAVQ